MISTYQELIKNLQAVVVHDGVLGALEPSPGHPGPTDPPKLACKVHEGGAFQNGKAPAQ